MSAPEFALLTSDDLVTGEAVALDLPAAGLGSRMISAVIDAAVTVVAFFLVLLVSLMAVVRSDEAVQSTMVVIAFVLVFVVYPTTLETLTRGRSLGKLAMGLRTVRDDAGPISAQHALIRALVGFVEGYSMLGVPAFFSVLLSSRGKRLGDYAAGTYVVRDRVGLRLPYPTPMPARLAGWARGADMSAIPTGLMLAVRSYLGRLPALDPASRLRIGGRLADQVAERVSPLPPRGTPPEEFLAAVVAERRERDLARLRRQDEFRRRLTAR